MPLSLSPFRRAVAVTATCTLAAGLLVAGSAPASALLPTDNDVTVVGYGDQNADYIAHLPNAIGGHKVLDVAVGNQASFILRDDNTVYRTYPWEPEYQEVTSLSNQFNGRQVTDLEASYTGTFALLSDGSLVRDTSQSGGASDGFSAATADQQFSEVSAGRHFAIALRADGTLRSWGQNSVGGDGTTGVDMIAAGYTHAIAHTTDGEILGFGQGINSTIADAGEAAIGDSEVLELAAGAGTNFALLEGGSVVSFGSNAAAYTSAVATALDGHAAVSIEARYTELYVIVDDGRVLSFETNPNASQTINADVAALANGHRVLQVTGGEFHTLLVLEEPEVSFEVAGSPLDGFAVTSDDSITVDGSGFLGGVDYDVQWDGENSILAATSVEGGISQTLGVPDDLAPGTHSITVSVGDEDYTQDFTVGSGFTTPVPTISGTAKVGVELTAVRGAWSVGTAFTYAWLRDGKTISGATSATYTPTAADYGKALQVKVTGTKTGIPAVSKTSLKTAKVTKGTIEPGYVDIGGDSEVGSTLTVHTEDWPSSTKFSYQWYAGSKAIAKATKSSYIPTGSVVDKYLSVRVTASKSGYGSVTVHRNAYFVDRGYINTGSYYPAGTAAVGKTLTATRYAGSTETAGVTRTYQWTANGEWIPGATKSTLKLTSALLGKYVEVRVFFAKTGYYPEYTSSYPTEVFAKAVTPGKVKLTGTAKVGSTLTLTVTGTPAGVDVYTYWVKKKGSAIVDLGYNIPTYTLQAEDKGYQVYAEVYFVKSGLAVVQVTTPLTKTVV